MYIPVVFESRGYQVRRTTPAPDDFHNRIRKLRARLGLTQEALAGLEVSAQSTTLPGAGVELHTILAGPTDGPLVLLLHGFPACW